MNKKSNKYILFFLGILAFFSCEKEDFCDGDVATPNVRIEFYDKANSSTLKPFYKITCFAESEIQNDTIKALVFSNVSEINLPLNVNASQTIWNLELTQIINNDTLTYLDKLSFNYTPKAEYVSRACGYKTVFNNLTTTLNQDGVGTWITNFTPLTNNIINEDNPHAKIYY